MDELRNILAQVQEGKTSFAPKGPSKEEIDAFQAVAKALVHAKEKGYLEDCHAHKESGSGSGYYDLVLLRGGLSYAGKQFLKESPSVEAQAVNWQHASSGEDVIDLKPNFFGLGVNLNALWRRLRPGKPYNKAIILIAVIAVVGIGAWRAWVYVETHVQPAQLEGASPKMDCNEKKTRCQDLSELIKRKETEVEKKNFQHMRLSGESGIDFDRKEKKARIPSPAEIASSNELKQLRDQIHALKDELFQCERTECANYSKK